MPQILELDQNTINQIAAGEVIERPASVVKELMENAIDAGATAVTVEIRDGGISFIRITDNGCGIPKDQLRVAFLRHTTSKIRSAEDLMTVTSLGFRGEALSSIAAVAQVELITKTADSVTGASYRIEGGQEKELSEIGAPDGTTFLIRNLFYNTPVRKKFLKTAATEGAYIVDLVERMALSHPNLSVRLIQNGQTKLNTSGNGKLKDIIYAVYGREITANVLPVEMSAPEQAISISGFLGKPVIARGNRTFENYFINGRYIHSRMIDRAIEDAYKPFMMQHRYPFTVLHLTIPSDLLDVNVHPAKMELRFRNEEALYDLICNTVKSGLTEKEFIPEVSLTQEKEASREPASSGAEPFEKKRLDAERVKELASYGEKSGKPGITSGRFYSNVKPGSEKESFSARLPFQTPDFVMREEAARYQSQEQQPPRYQQKPEPPENQTAKQMELFEHPLLSKAARKEHRLIGQLFETYWLIQYQDKLFIMDQHAAHEKVLYERTMKRIREQKEVYSQTVSPPVIVTVGEKEQELLKAYKDTFSRLGYEISYFGGKEYAIGAIPAELLGVDTSALFLELLDGLTEDGHLSADTVLDKAASISCKAAVKGNHAMSFAEADALIGQLMALENPYACPHGRPTIISMSKYEIEKKFKRIV